MPRKQKKKDRHAPSEKEKCQKIDQAIEALEANRYLFIAERHREMEYDFLGISSENELLDWVAVFLAEIKDIGPSQCFIGDQAQRCNHKRFKDLFLFAYSWDSPSLEKEAYLKFAIRRETTASGGAKYYCHLDCHENQPTNT